MKRSILFTALACSLAFYACTKKEDVITDVTPPPIPVVIDTTPAPAKIDPVKLAADVTIGYGGTSVNGTFPATSADAAAPKLDSAYDGRTYYAVNNRYVVIYPRTTNGFVQGYYLTINGSSSYYKIDYGVFEETIIQRKAARKRTGKSEDQRENGGHEDSTIVIKLPANLIGDVFSIKYAAYDKENRVSNPVSANVKVIASPDAADNSKIQGSWDMIGYKQDYEEWDYEYRNGQETRDLYCLDDHLYWSMQAGATTVPQVVTSSYREPITYEFGANNAFAEIFSYYYTNLDWNNSSCSNVVYTKDDYPNDWYNRGGYSYNATTKELTIIYDEDGQGENIYTEKYYVKELTAEKIIIYQVYRYERNEIERDYYELKKIK